MTRGTGDEPKAPEAACGRRLRARWLDPRGPERCDYIADAYIAWDDRGRLVEVGSYEGQAIDEDLRTGVLAPGFVDTHVHYPQLRAMGQANGPLLPWLEQSIFPEEARFSDLGYAQEVAEAFCDAMLRSGTTGAFVYGSVHAAASAGLMERLESRGLQAIAGPVLMDEGAPDELLVPTSVAIEALERLLETWPSEVQARVRLGVIPRFALSCSESMLQAAGDFARAHGLHVSTHIAETQAEGEATCRRFGASDYLEVYERYKLVGPRTVLAHCIHFDEAQWKRFAAAGAIVAHCPDSNDFLGSGSMSAAAAQGVGAQITLGSDVAAGRGFCMRAHMRAAYDCALRRGQRLSPATLYWWATGAGRKALGFTRDGTLRVGDAADLVYFSLPDWLLEPVQAGSSADERTGVGKLLSALIFDPTHVSVHRVWAEGRLAHGSTDGS